MKIIELLNKKVNGEQTPNKFKYKKYTFEKDKDDCYIEQKEYDYFVQYLNIDFSNLNDEIEIIEEDKKIEKIDMFDYFTGYEFGGIDKSLLKHLEHNFQETNSKFNEIINKLNEMSDKE